MDLVCSYQNCSAKAEISCVCRLQQKYFCADHFMLHRKENPTTRHMFSDIWPEDEQNNGLCEVCFVNSPIFTCLCANRSFLLCQDCIGTHSKVGVSHCLEPLEAAEFVKQAGKVSDYFHRKSKVQKCTALFQKTLDDCSEYKRVLRERIEKSIEKLRSTLNSSIQELEQVERDLFELKGKVDKAQFEYKLDLSDKVLRILEESDYEALEKILKSIFLFSVSVNEKFFISFDSPIVEIVNNVKKFTNYTQKLSEYFKENNHRMTESVKELFQTAIAEKDKQRISVLEEYPNIAEDLSAVVGRFSGLQCLDLSGNNIGPQGAKLLFSAMKGLVEIKEINIGGNYILDEGCLCLCEALPGLKKLENLFLYKNALTDKAGKALAEYLHCCGLLKMISLNQNTLGDDGLAWLTGAFVRLEELEAIGLQRNQLTKKSAKYVASLIREVKNLQDLSLDENEIDDNGAVEIMGAFGDARNVMKIYIRNNKVSEDVQVQLKNSRKDFVFVAIDYMIY